MTLIEIRTALRLLWYQTAGPVLQYLRWLRRALILAALTLILVVVGEFVAVGGSVPIGRSLIFTGWLLTLIALGFVYFGVTVPLRAVTSLGAVNPDTVRGMASALLKTLAVISIFSAFLFLLGVYSSFFIFVSLVMLGVTLMLVLAAWPGTGVWGRRCETGLKAVLAISILGLVGYVALSQFAPDRMTRFGHWRTLITSDPAAKREVLLDDLDKSVEESFTSDVEIFKSELDMAIKAKSDTNFSPTWTTGPWDMTDAEQRDVLRRRFRAYVERLGSSKNTPQPTFVSGGQHLSIGGVDIKSFLKQFVWLFNIIATVSVVLLVLLLLQKQVFSKFGRILIFLLLLSLFIVYVL